MDNYNKVMKRLLPALRDVVGIDFGTSATKAVRIKADASGAMTVVAADILPPCPMPAEGEEAPPAISVPRSLAAWTASLAFTSRKAVIKLVTEPKGSTYNLASAPELLGLQKDHGLRIGLQRFENGEEHSVRVLNERMEVQRELQIGAKAKLEVPGANDELIVFEIS